MVSALVSSPREELTSAAAAALAAAAAACLRHVRPLQRLNAVPLTGNSNPKSTSSVPKLQKSGGLSPFSLPMKHTKCLLLFLMEGSKHVL